MNLALNGRFLSQSITGVQRVAHELSSRLISRIDGCTWYVPSGSTFDRIHTTVSSKKSFRFGNDHIWEQLSLPYLLKSNHSPLLINFTGIGPLRYARNACFAYDASLFRHPEWFSFAYRTFYRNLMPVAFKNAQIIFTISEFSKAELVETLGMDPAKIVVLYLAAASIFSCEKVSVPNFASKLVETPYILAVGSMDPRKNLVRLISATRAFRERGVKLLLVGNSHSAFNCGSFPQNLNIENVGILGGINDTELAWLYQNALCLAFPSLYEGFGLPIIEAMACGCPIVCSNIPPLKEVGGNAIECVEALEEESIYEGIKKVIESSQVASEMITKGLNQSKLYNWDLTADKFVASIRPLM